MKHAIAVPIALFVLVFTAITASAAPPVRFPATFRDTPFFCPTFEGLVTAPIDNEYVTIFSEARAQITGRMVVTWTNPNNGESVTANVSGPGFFTLKPDGTEIDISTGLHGSSAGVFAGRIVQTYYPDGSFTVSMVGRTKLDVCATLA